MHTRSWTNLLFINFCSIYIYIFSLTLCTYLVVCHWKKCCRMCGSRPKWDEPHSYHEGVTLRFLRGKSAVTARVFSCGYYYYFAAYDFFFFFSLCFPLTFEYSLYPLNFYSVTRDNNFFFFRVASSTLLSKTNTDLYSSIYIYIIDVKTFHVHYLLICSRSSKTRRWTALGVRHQAAVSTHIATAQIVEWAPSRTTTTTTAPTIKLLHQSMKVVV